ncbi:MAG: replication factor C large subunit [Candidatus Ranarchaeia archaeon]
MSFPWVQKYSPQSLKEIIGQPGSINKLLTWLKSWKLRPPPKRAVFIKGGPGTGKTHTVHLLAKELDYDIVELNSTNFRGQKSSNQFLKASSDQTSLFGYDNFRILLFDEVEGLSGRYDRGGLKALTEIVKVSKNPIIITSSAIEDYKYRTLLKYCEKINFRSIQKNSISKKLQEIIKIEGIPLSEEIISQIVENSNGDIRAAINDLQKVSNTGNVKKKDLSSLIVPRDISIGVIPTLEGIFKSSSIKDATFALRQSTVDYNMVLRWISENIPRIIKHRIELESAYKALGKSSLFLSRIRKRQSWNLLPYALEQMSAGVALSQIVKPQGWLRFQFPLWLSKLSKFKAIRNNITSIKETIGNKLHTSGKELIQVYIPYMRIMMENHVLAKALITDLQLNEEQANFLTGKTNFKRIMKS